MLLQKKIGMRKAVQTGEEQVEYIRLQWYETARKILHKQTDRGRQVTIKLFSETDSLQHDDVLYADATLLICIDVLPVKAIVCAPASMQEMAHVCYEIGNKHLPLFYDRELLLMPYEEPIYRLLLAAGYRPVIESRQLLQQMKTSVTPHGHGSTLFSKILQLTAKNES